MKQKKIPLRKCLGCGCQKPKQELVRVVRSAEGEVSLDLTGKKAGRGSVYMQKRTVPQGGAQSKADRPRVLGDGT